MACKLAVLAPLSLFLAQRSVQLIAGVLISNVSFIFAARELYRYPVCMLLWCCFRVPLFFAIRLSLSFVDNHRLAIVSVALFTLNPASIFLTAVYCFFLLLVRSLNGLAHTFILVATLKVSLRCALFVHCTCHLCVERTKMHGLTRFSF